MPISTPRDNNRIATLIAAINTDGVTVKSLVVTDSTNRLQISNGISGSGFGGTTAQRDANRVPAIWGVSSADGVTPVAIYCDSNGKLLTQST